MRYRLLIRALILLVASFPLLASSVTFCASGDIYNQPYDQSDEFWSRWENGQAQITPQWTPDGSRIVFGHHGRIYAVDADGGNLDLLSGSNASLGPYSETHEIDFSPTTSPDGSHVAYTTLRYATGSLYEHTYEIAIQNIEGGDLQRLTLNGWDDVSPVWSPDGNHIAFMSHRRGHNGIYTIALDVMDEYSITPTVKVLSDVPVWSPDGKRLAFVSESTESLLMEWVDTSHRESWYKRITKTGNKVISKQAIYTVEPDGTNLTRLAWAADQNPTTHVRANESELALPEEEIIEYRWSPDSKQIAFFAKRYGELGSLYVAEYDGSQVQQILDLKAIAEANGYDAISIQGLSWSSYSPEIYFELVGATYDSLTSDWENAYVIHNIGSDGSGLRTLTEMADDNAVGSHLEWPGILLREAGRGYRDPSLRYRNWPELLEMTGPARILRYEWGHHYFGPNAKAPLLSIVPWDSTEEKVLVTTDGRIVELAEP